MRTPELETISIFSKDISLNLTINQISKKLNKSYAFTNKYIRDFLADGILRKKVVGSAILCALNFSNERTLGLLMLNSIEQKTRFLKKANEKTKKIIERIQNIPTLKSLFITKKGFNIICENKEQFQFYLEDLSKQFPIIKQSKITILDQNEFKLSFRSIDFEGLTIMEGYEAFWKLIAQMV